MTFTVKRGDTSPAFRAQCLDGSTPINLSGAQIIRLLMRSESAATQAHTMTAEDQTTSTGWVRYQWQPTDLAVVGFYRAEVEVTWGDGTVQTFPADSYATISVEPDLG